MGTDTGSVAGQEKWAWKQQLWFYNVGLGRAARETGREGGKDGWRRKRKKKKK